MSVDVAGRHVVVTGGANGIGAALAREAAARGARTLSIVDVDVEAAQVTAEQVSKHTAATAHAYGCDVASAAAVEDVAEAVTASHGLPALVCANAGVSGPTAPLLETPPEMVSWILGVNIRGVLHTLQSFGRRLVVSEAGGWLLATGSEHSLGVPHVNAGAYTASKHAVLGLCDVLRRELPDHVGISVLCPGLTASRLWKAIEQRPEAMGGPQSADPATGLFMENAGMAAATVATRAFDALSDGHFLIPTHYNARAYAQARAAEADEAFERLAAIDTTDYDLPRLVDQMLSGMEDA